MQTSDTRWDLVKIIIAVEDQSTYRSPGRVLEHSMGVCSGCREVRSIDT